MPQPYQAFPYWHLSRTDARQADDDSLRKLADRIQARAVRRCGELRKQYDARGKKGGTSLSRTDAAADAGMSDDQRKQAVRVANVPSEEFEAATESDSPPSVTALAALGKQSRPAPEGFRQATHLLGKFSAIDQEPAGYQTIFFKSAVR